MNNFQRQHALSQQQNVLSAIREVEDAISALEKTAEEQTSLDKRRVSLVAVARNYGASWQQIARALGTSKQAAWERFGSLDQTHGSTDE